MNLETKFPPPVVMLICGILMYGLAKIPIFQNVFSHSWLLIAVLVGLGLGVGVASVRMFVQAKTTINPVELENTSNIVSHGVYRFSRNPMYLAMACFLSAWAIALAQPLAWLGVVAFVAYITRFQILPEERFLTQKFGAEYTDYCQKVRRWI